MLTLDDDLNLDELWLVKDGLSITNSLYFSLGKTYFCGHGCKVCYIRDELRALHGKTQHIYGNDLKVMEPIWDEVSSFFMGASLDEDPFYLKLNHPNDYQWFVDNAYKFSYGTTDNGLFRMARLKEIKFKDMFEIAISLTFLRKVTEDKLINALNQIEYPINRIKFLVDIPDYYPQKVIDWIKERKIAILINATDFLTGVTTPFHIEDYPHSTGFNWVVGVNSEELIKIYVGSDSLLYYDTFHFSNNTKGNPYFKINNGFDHRLFLSSMLEGKQNTYLKFMKNDLHPNVRRYFETTQRYKVNHDYNFIPHFMVNYQIRYFNRMTELGWTATRHGLLAPNAKNIIPIIEKKK